MTLECACRVVLGGRGHCSRVAHDGLVARVGMMLRGYGRCPRMRADTALGWEK